MPSSPPEGIGPGTDYPTGRCGVPPNLPGAEVENPPPPPGTTPVPPPQAPPRSWADPLRLIRIIIDLWEKDPEGAKEVQDFARDKLAEINKKISEL